MNLLSQLSRVLSHSAWQGVSGILTLAALLVTVYAIQVGPGQQPQTGQQIHSDAGGTQNKRTSPPANRQAGVNPQPTRPIGQGTTNNPYQDATQNSHDITDESLNSIDENYRGVDPWFKDRTPLSVIAISLFFLALVALFLGRQAT